MTDNRAPYRIVLEEGIGLDDSCWNLANLLMNRFLNMVGGRASDAARSEVHWHKVYGCEKYREEFEKSTNSLYGETRRLVP